MELNEADLKTLKLFSYYVQSYGVKECDLYVDYYSCGIDYLPTNWESLPDRTQIEGYDKINELMERICDSIELENYFDECERYGRVEFNFDAKERKMIANAFEQVYGDNDMGTEFTKEDIDEEVLEFMDKLKQDGFKSGKVTFDGGGDSGYIESKIVLNDGNDEDIPSGVEDFLYAELQNFYGGWEINEGSHGSFNFEFEENTIWLEFYEHTETMEDRGKVLYIEF